MKAYGWLEDTGSLTFIFTNKIKVAACFMSSIEMLKTKEFQKKHKGKLVKLNIEIIGELKNE